MLFNSLSFLIFFPVVFALYWLVGNARIRLQNILLLAASYFFYGWWDYRFVFLLAFSTALDFYTGLRVHASTGKLRKMWLWISVGTNLGFLGFFKYYNFFVGSFASASQALGFQPELWILNIILPVGISFYTFHGLSYVFDIYNKKVTPTSNVVDYAVFVSFFPLLVAGPIERATHLLPQVEKPRTFNYTKAVDGLHQILWGFFKKIIVADQCAEYVTRVFDDPSQHNGSTLAIAAVLFSFQIYCDFSGYSDIALGTARLLGFELLRNFNFPYFSRDIAEFWRRWHISLTSWFRDYLYIPLGGSRGGKVKQVRNTFIIFLVSGFWHGANWTFIVWGALHALYFLPLLLLGQNRNHIGVVASGKLLPNLREALQISATFALTTFAWIFFRSPTVSGSFDYIKKLFSMSLFSAPLETPSMLIVVLPAFVVIEWIGRSQSYAIEAIAIIPRPLRWLLYYSVLLAIFIFSGKEHAFIYFQF